MRFEMFCTYGLEFHILLSLLSIIFPSRSKILVDKL